MAIEKIISADWEVRHSFAEPMKIASGYTPETYVHPEIQQFAETVQPDPRFCYAHVIAMSDGGHYGSNMNGDWFKAAELTGMQSPEEAIKNEGDLAGTPVPRFKTFEQAKFFKHHDNSNFSPYFGDVPLAVWNDAMKRVELIIRIFRQAIPEMVGSVGAPDVAIRIDNGGYITVSMGCRIHHEQCMYCGNENEFVSQRCDHLKNHMNEIMPDGRLVAADNFGMRFFDISNVTIPADPIAYSLGKVAAQRAFMPGNPAYDRVDLEKLSEWRRKWAEIEKEVSSDGSLASQPNDVAPLGTTEEEPEQFSEEELQGMLAQANGNIDEVVSTLTAAGVVLSPVELAHLSALATPEKAAEFAAPTSLSLDNFNYGLYHSLADRLSTRSGFMAPCPIQGWEPSKLAEQGEAAAEVADYYSYYRSLICSLTTDGFTKSAYRNPVLRELVSGDDGHDRVKAAMYYLAFAGLST